MIKSIQKFKKVFPEYTDVTKRRGCFMFENLKIKTIDYKTAMQIIIEKHYLHRKCSCSIAFGLFNNNTLVGVAILGKPASYTLCNGIAGNDESKNVIEFSRLWVCDSMPKIQKVGFVGFVTVIALSQLFMDLRI